MASRIASLVLAGSLAAWSIGGCVTRFEPASEAAPHAVLAFPSQSEGAAVGVLVEPLEINSLARPQALVLRELRVPSGDLRLLARAAYEDRQGTCLLHFSAVAGERYVIGAVSSEEAFTIRASHGSRALAECIAAGEISPTPLRLRGVIPAE